MRVWLPLVLVLASCGGAVGSTGPSSTLPTEARGALEQIYVDGHSYTLPVDLYRDLMPGPAPTPKRGVGGTIFLTADRESDPSAGGRAGKARLINRTGVWGGGPPPPPTLPGGRQPHPPPPPRPAPPHE